MTCIYCDSDNSEYVRTVWDTDAGAYCEEWRCSGCGQIHGEYLLGEPVDIDDEIDPAEAYRDALEFEAGEIAAAELSGIMGDDGIPEAERQAIYRETVQRIIVELEANAS